VWRERGAEEVESAIVTSTIAAATAAIAVTAFAALTHSLSLPSFLPTVTHALCSSCLRFWKEELQCGVHLWGDDGGKVPGLRQERSGEERRDRVVSMKFEGANRIVQCSIVQCRVTQREGVIGVMYQHSCVLWCYKMRGKEDSAPREEEELATAFNTPRRYTVWHILYSY
jgi:hypothetical protein